MLTQWIQKIISMLLVMSAVLQVIPGKDYEVYQQYEKEIERMSDSIKREEIGIGQ